MLGGLPESSATLLRKETHLLGLALMVPEDARDGEGEGDDDDAERSKSPAVGRVEVEQLSDLGTTKGRSKSRAHVQSPDNHSVSERGHVRDDNVNNVAEADVTDPVEGVTSSVGLDVLAQSLHDDAHDDKEDHEEEAIVSAANINNLGNGKLGNTSDYGTENAGDGEETVLVEGRGDVRDKTTVNGLKKSIDELDKVQAVNCSVLVVRCGKRGRE